MWSPDGSEIAFATPGLNEPFVIYPDGSCLACPVPAPSGSFYLDGWDPKFRPGFLPDGRLVVSIDVAYPPVGYPPAPQLGAVSTDGIGFRPFAISGFWRQPAWSPTGRLAAVRRVGRKSEVFAIDPRIRSARQVTRNGASSPTWSPDGRRLAVVHRGWIELIGAGGGRVRRLTRGAAPAWAPNGKEIAFVGAHHRLFVIAARGGRPRPVGHIHAARVDWQPVTGQPPSGCHAPAGSSVVAASPDATVVIDPGPTGQYPDPTAPAFSVLGCLASDGRERLLESMSQSDSDNALGVGAVVVAGDYAALVNRRVNTHYGGSKDTVAVFDLRTGSPLADRGGESATCQDIPCYTGVDQLVLGADAATAAHTFFTNCGSTCTTAEQIVANDSTGTHTLDSITTTGPYNPTPSSLSQLALSGHTLTWSHAGSARTAQLN